MFAGKAGPYLLKNLSDAPLKGRLLALPINNTLGGESLPGTNTLAYYQKTQHTAVKSFITSATGFSVIKRTFFVKNMEKIS